MSDPSKPPADPPSAEAPASRLDRLVRGARLTIGVERLWPFVVLAAVLVAVFVALSWLGLWVAAPRVARVMGVVALAGGLVAIGLVALRGASVARGEALARLDRDSGLPHRPVSAAEDRLANGGDALTQALWDLSRKRLEGTLTRLRLRLPAPRLVDRDPYALRSCALLALVAAAFVAGEHKDGLIAAAFDWRGVPGRTPGFRVDAWIDPPGYTRKPPVMLLAGSEPAEGAEPSLAVPVHAIVVVRSSGEGALDIATKGGLKPAAPGAPGAPGAAAPNPVAAVPAAGAEHRFDLEGNGHIALTHEGTVMRTASLTAIPDLPPTIALTGTPRATAHGGLTLAYTIGDDYGVTGAEATFSEPTLPDAPSPRSLVPPPKLALNLPPTPGGLGAGQTTGDLSDHPWAGAEVTLVLNTHDEGGNVGLSAPLRMTLPARPFNNPLARALVEQRRTLVLDPDHRDGLGLALDALMINPERFGTSNAVYLGLYTARQRLAAARNDADLVALADFLWEMALRIEDDGRSETARDLQAAEQALRDALQRNASADEIKRLTDDLRRKMDKMLSELSRQAQTAQQDRPDPNARTVTADQLKQMMQRMEQMAESGNTAEAQRMLDQLQAMLDNMRSARNGATGQAQRDMNRQMSDLDKMTRDQQALRDKTFRQGRRSDGGQPSPEDGDQDDQSAQQGPPQAGDGQPQADAQGGDDLQGQQGGLRQRLDELQRRMRQLGLQGEKGLDEAEQAMKDAEGALGQGQPGNRRAVDAQGRALQGLQQGANGLAQQMTQQGQSGEQEGEGDGTSGTSISRGNPGQDGDDPLGRPRSGHGPLETRGRALDESVAARAQRVLQELRRRLGDPSRSTAETDYLERLLQRY